MALLPKMMITGRLIKAMRPIKISPMFHATENSSSAPAKTNSEAMERKIVNTQPGALARSPAKGHRVVGSGLIAEEEAQIYLGVVEVTNQGSEAEEQQGKGGEGACERSDGQGHCVLN